MKRCVACDENIRVNAKLCKHCGTEQSDARFTSNSKEPSDLDLQLPRRTRMCPSCDEMCEEDAGACWSCSTDLEADPRLVATINEDVRNEWLTIWGSGAAAVFALESWMNAFTNGGRFLIFLPVVAVFWMVRASVRLRRERMFAASHAVTPKVSVVLRWLAVLTWALVWIEFCRVLPLLQ